MEWRFFNSSGLDLVFSVAIPGGGEVREQSDRLVDMGCYLNDTDGKFSLHLSNNMLARYHFCCYPHDPTMPLKYIATKIRFKARHFSIEVNNALGTTKLALSCE